MSVAEQIAYWEEQATLYHLAGRPLEAGECLQSAKTLRVILKKLRSNPLTARLHR